MMKSNEKDGESAGAMVKSWRHHVNCSSLYVCFSDHHRSILTDNDWKKLWMVAGSTNYDSKSENNIDSSDSPQFEDTEVRKYKTHTPKHNVKKNIL